MRIGGIDRKSGKNLYATPRPGRLAAATRVASSLLRPATRAVPGIAPHCQGRYAPWTEELGARIPFTKINIAPKRAKSAQPTRKATSFAVGFSAVTRTTSIGTT
jgi:hypothetical protein